MRTRQQTKNLTSLGLAALFSTSVPQPLPIQQLSPETNAEISRQHIRFAALVKAGKYDDAEQAVTLLESLDRRFVSGGLRGRISLMRGEYSEALRHFTSQYVPDPGQSPRDIRGDYEERAWYYFLNVQAGRKQEAVRALKSLLDAPALDPMGGAPLDVMKYSNNTLACVYAYLAAKMNSQRNFYRMKIYLECAKQIDPKIKLHPNFEVAMKQFGFSEKFNLDFETKYGSGYPIVDYRVYEKATKSKAKLF